MIKRTFNPLLLQSFFLFGARGTGKSTVILELLKKEKVLNINLLDPSELNNLILNPNQLRERIEAEKPNWCFLDEVQKIPKLLDLVHQLIFEKRCKFALTGSSARKLRRGGANLLAGRAFLNYLFPLTSTELGEDFNLSKALEFGTLPAVYLEGSKEVRKTQLRTYVHTYIKEEIAEEQILRKLEPFRRFLAVLGQCSGKIINYSNIAKDVGTTSVTVQNYFQIIEDTLLGFFLEPFHTSIRKRQALSPKFYLIDCGISRALSNVLTVNLTPQTYEYGNLFEQFVISEIRARSFYKQNDFSFSFYRTKDDVEIDLIVERPGLPLALIEIKSTASIKDEHLSHIKSLSKSFLGSECYCFCNEKHKRQSENVLVVNWQEGIRILLNE